MGSEAPEDQLGMVAERRPNKRAVTAARSNLAPRIAATRLLACGGAGIFAHRQNRILLWPPHVRKAKLFGAFGVCGQSKRGRDLILTTDSKHHPVRQGHGQRHGWY